MNFIIKVIRGLPLLIISKANSLSHFTIFFSYTMPAAITMGNNSNSVIEALHLFFKFNTKPFPIEITLKRAVDVASV